MVPGALRAGLFGEADRGLTAPATTHMTITTEDLVRLELVLRTEAEVLRTSWPESAADGAEVKRYAARMRGKAHDLDTIADLVVGLIGDWDGLGPQVRAGYQRAVADYERAKAANAKKEAA